MNFETLNTAKLNETPDMMGRTWHGAPPQMKREIMTEYAMLYERINVATHKPETVVVYYADESPLSAEHRETIAAPRSEAEQTMIAQGWKYANTPGPQSILLKRESE